LAISTVATWGAVLTGFGGRYCRNSFRHCLEHHAFNGLRISAGAVTAISAILAWRTRFSRRERRHRLGNEPLDLFRIRIPALLPRWPRLASGARFRRRQRGNRVLEQFPNLTDVHALAVFTVAPGRSWRAFDRRARLEGLDPRQQRSSRTRDSLMERRDQGLNDGSHLKCVHLQGPLVWLGYAASRRSCVFASSLTSWASASRSRSRC
jgi:hypothetical protein